MDKELIKDIIEWDIKNWSNALTFWSENAAINGDKKTCLELGGRCGGLSLWLALNGNDVVCSDLESPKEHASQLHTKYDLGNKVKYEAINATNIPYKDHFDLVAFKSIIGGIAREGNDALKQKTIDEIYKSLKPNGKLLFVENLESSVLHKTLRKQFIKWGGQWNYLKYDEVHDLFSSFSSLKFQTIGFLGAFGRTEGQRRFLSYLDFLIKPFVPKNKRYIIYGVAEK